MTALGLAFADEESFTPPEATRVHQGYLGTWTVSIGVRGRFTILHSRMRALWTMHRSVVRTPRDKCYDHKFQDISEHVHARETDASARKTKGESCACIFIIDILKKHLVKIEQCDRAQGHTRHECRAGLRDVPGP